MFDMTCVTCRTALSAIKQEQMLNINKGEKPASWVGAVNRSAYIFKSLSG